MTNFHVDILTIDREIFSGEVKGITMPGVEGVFTVLAKHMPFVTPLTFGEVTFKDSDNKETFLTVGKGVFLGDGKKASLLIEDASFVDEISESKALEARQRAEELIKKGVSKEEKVAAIYQYRKSLVDIRLARKLRRKETLH
ncbi:ATP synthase F1 subunit epsilon [Candidatus Woesebacteria bacterium RIFCSPLOWO2_01_FULL_39_21]|uniref:ATP synthase epsilon chain n=1 Tax=Candidatus Woesebacteria bacterium RIFCSPLOWO2_01_FULL_39_21 TaxID=1802519 RepID=A0A1F8BKU0_9BACT|nr:MAG: ATP synthase F1 subunit epsilon [Candidatus Woesebacteria bacterium RIFCSPLOWO2_01_FULL_39_21]